MRQSFPQSIILSSQMFRGRFEFCHSFAQDPLLKLEMTFFQNWIRVVQPVLLVMRQPPVSSRSSFSYRIDLLGSGCSSLGKHLFSCIPRRLRSSDGIFGIIHQFLIDLEDCLWL